LWYFDNSQIYDHFGNHKYVIQLKIKTYILRRLKPLQQTPDFEKYDLWWFKTATNHQRAP
jgi:hypothetical protein